jgi:GGDEF domain-containing protein
LIGIESDAKALQIAESMIAKISTPIDIGHGNVARASASIGIAFPNEGETLDAVLWRADSAMYAAKQAGRSCARLANQETIATNPPPVDAPARTTS